MRYLVMAIIVIMASIAAADIAFARGGPLHLLGPFDHPSVPVSRAGIPTPSISPSDLLAGCGRGRYRDPATHRCRGPADVPN